MNTAIKRALQILEYLTTESDWEGEGVTSIGRNLNIPKSSAFDILDSLTELGFLECLDDKRYRIGNKATFLGFKVLGEHACWTVTRKHLETLNKETNFTVTAGIAFGSNIILTDKLPPLIGMSISGGIGSSSPIHVSALGKAILACHEDEEIKSIVGTPCFIPYTRNSIININQLFKNIRAIRKNGFAVNNFEEDDYVYGIAAPVFDSTGKVCEAIGVSAFVHDIRKIDLQRLADQVKRCAAAISNELKSIESNI